MPKKKVTEAVEETAQETIPVEKAPAQMPRRQGTAAPTTRICMMPATTTVPATRSTTTFQKSSTA